MRVQAKQRRRFGISKSQQQIERGETVEGDLLVAQEKSDTFGRYSNVARFYTSGANDAELLPALHDVVLSWMGPHGFVLTGIEVIDGVAYAQSWWCKAV